MATSSRNRSAALPRSPGLESAMRHQQPTPDDDRGKEQEEPKVHLCRHDHEHDSLHNRHRKDVDENHELEHNISLPAGSKHAEETIRPFLAEHIPMQYNPTTTGPKVGAGVVDEEEQGHDTKFCYRHRPDLKCRRQANEPSMEQLQNELATLSQSDQQAISHVWSLFSAAPAKHRNLMLQGILTQCCFPQLSFISANIRDLIKIDFLAALPPELGFRILCYLDTTSLCKASQVSQRWRMLADDDVVWHKMCEQHIDRKCTKCGWGLPLLERKRLRIEKRQIQLRATGRGLNEWSPAITPLPEDVANTSALSLGPAASSALAGTKRSVEDGMLSPASSKRPCTSSQGQIAIQPSSDDAYFAPRTRKRPWKDVYKDRFKVGTAWKYGRCSTRVFKGHTNGVMAVQFDDNVLISGSYDNTAKVWDIHTGAEIRTLKGHTSGIRCLQFDDSKLMTAGLDLSLRMWNWKTGEEVRHFPAHQTMGIISLHFAGRYVATGSMDQTVRILDFVTKQTFLLRGHTDWVNCVKVDEASRTVFSASDDLTVRMWDLDTHHCIKVFEGHVGQVQSLELLPAEFELDAPSRVPAETDDDSSSAGSPDPQDHRRDTSNLNEPSFWTSNAERTAPPRYMLTGALDSTIRLWDTHVQQDRQFPPEPALTDPNAPFVMLPTDPLTNSHVPRACACVRTFFGHVEGIWALAADHLRLVSGGEDGMMKVWDPRTGKCERTFTGHAGPVTCTWLSDSRVASGSDDCEVRMLCFGDV